MPTPREINFNATYYKNVNLSLTGSQTDGHIYVSTYARPECRGIKKEKEAGGGGGGGAAQVSDIL